MIRDILRFNREAPSLLDAEDESITLDDYLRDRQYSTEFVNHYLAPMGGIDLVDAAGQISAVSRPLYRGGFFRNHGLLQGSATGRKGRRSWVAR